MKIVSSDREPREPFAPTKLDWDVVEQAQRQARKLRAEAFTHALSAPGRAIRSLVDRARAPVNFEPVGTCP